MGVQRRLSNKLRLRGGASLARKCVELAAKRGLLKFSVNPVNSYPKHTQKEVLTELKWY